MYVYSFIYQIIFKLVLAKVPSSIRVLDKGILPLEKNSIAIQFYLDLVNEGKLDACRMHSRAKECCLIVKENTECDSVKLYGEHFDDIMPKDRDTILYIYPTMSQHNQIGYCNFVLDYWCGSRKTRRKEEVKVPFDTRIKKRTTSLLKGYLSGKKAVKCEGIDLDSLNQCEPVNCELKYFGARPIFNVDLKKCSQAAECITDPQKKLPDMIFEPVSNTCKDLDHPLTIADIYAISSGLGIVKANETKADTKLVLEANCYTISQNLQFLRDLLYGKLCPIVKGYSVDFRKPCKSAILAIFTCIFGLAALLILLVLCIHAVVWLKTGAKKAKDLRSRIITKDLTNIEGTRSTVNINVKNKLLKEVLVSDLPLELRDSVVDLCERIGREEVRWKKRFRIVGNQVDFKFVDDTTDTETTSDLDTSEKERLLK